MPQHLPEGGPDRDRKLKAKKRLIAYMSEARCNGCAISRHFEAQKEPKRGFKAVSMKKRPKVTCGLKKTNAITAGMPVRTATGEPSGLNHGAL